MITVTRRHPWLVGCLILACQRDKTPALGIKRTGWRQGLRVLCCSCLWDFRSIGVLLSFMLCLRMLFSHVSSDHATPRTGGCAKISCLLGELLSCVLSDERDRCFYGSRGSRTFPRWRCVTTILPVCLLLFENQEVVQLSVVKPVRSTLMQPYSR